MVMSLAESLRPYAQKPVISVFILGISSGFPWVMIGSALSLWLKEANLSRSAIGFAGLIFSVYAINFLWAPLLDRYTPVIGNLGKRRAWICISQIFIAVCCAAMSQFNPAQSALPLMAAALLLAFCSASQDVAVDAYRTDGLNPSDPKNLTANSVATMAGWWTGYAGLGGLPLILSDQGYSWPQLYWLMAAIMAALWCITWILPDPAFKHVHRQDKGQYSYSLSAGKKLRLVALLITPVVLILWGVLAGVNSTSVLTFGIKADYLVALLILLGLVNLALIVRSLMGVGAAQPVPQATRADGTLHWLMTTIVAPLAEFFHRQGARYALNLLLFMLVFKLGEAMLGRMSIVFYKEVGFTNTQIAEYSKLLTWWATVLFAIPCGILNARLGTFKGLFLAGIFMAASNLMFSVIAIKGPDTAWLAAAVLVDGFTAAWATVAFVAFISAQCNQKFSATQYALFASIGNFGRTNIAANSGVLVNMLGGNWALFFVLTSLMVIPGLWILWRMRNTLENKAS
jgi:MFS transporter, PAT family, beta-lactamase induction signal transducer AmpG